MSSVPAKFDEIKSLTEKGQDCCAKEFTNSSSTSQLYPTSCLLATHAEISKRQLTPRIHASGFETLRYSFPFGEAVEPPGKWSRAPARSTYQACSVHSQDCMVSLDRRHGLLRCHALCRRSAFGHVECWSRSLL